MGKSKKYDFFVICMHKHTTKSMFSLYIVFTVILKKYIFFTFYSQAYKTIKFPCILYSQTYHKTFFCILYSQTYNFLIYCIQKYITKFGFLVYCIHRHTTKICFCAYCIHKHTQFGRNDPKIRMGYS